MTRLNKMRPIWRAMAFVGVGVFAGGAAAAPDSLTVTYVGNEGFLVEVAEHKVLIDALFRTGVAGYVVHPPDRRRALERADAPFDGVELVLATHYHADHFDPRTVGSHLVNNSRARFVSTSQAVDELEQVFPAWKHIAPRVATCSPAPGESEVIEFPGIRLTCLNLHHGKNRPVENLGLLVEIGDAKFLHIGDTEASPSEIQAYNLADLELDVVFVPYWFLAYGEWDGQIEPTFGDATLIAMHVPPADDPKGYLSDIGGFQGTAQKIAGKYPSAVIFEEEMEVRSVEDRPSSSP